MVFPKRSTRGKEKNLIPSLVALACDGEGNLSHLRRNPSLPPPAHSSPPAAAGILVAAFAGDGVGRVAAFPNLAVVLHRALRHGVVPAQVIARGRGCCASGCEVLVLA